MYTQYCNNYQDALSAIQQCNQDPRFTQFIEVYLWNLFFIINLRININIYNYFINKYKTIKIYKQIKNYSINKN